MRISGSYNNNFDLKQKNLKKTLEIINALPSRFNKQKVILDLNPIYIPCMGNPKLIKNVGRFFQRLPTNLVFKKLKINNAGWYKFALHDIYLALTRCKQFSIACEHLCYSVAPQIQMNDIEADSIAIRA